MHNLTILVDTYGYLAIFVGSIFEGETVVLLSGLLSHENLLSFPWIIFYALLATLINDWTWFVLGRFKGERILNKWAWFKRFMGKPIATVCKKPATLSFAMRFMYGFRHIIPFSIGMSKLPAKTFFLWNSFGAVVWVSLYGLIGYALGDVLESMLGRIKRFELLLAVCIIVLIVFINIVTTLIKNMLKGVVDDRAEM